MKKNYSFNFHLSQFEWQKSYHLLCFIFMFTTLFFTSVSNSFAIPTVVKNAAANTIRLEVNTTKTGNVLDCAVTEILMVSQIYVNNTLTEEGFSYSWTGPNNFEGNTKEIKVSKPGTYSLFVNNNNGLSATKEYIVYGPGFPSNYAGPDLNMYPSDASIQLKGKAYNFYYVSWRASNGGNIVTGVNTYTPTVDAPGTYIISLTSPAGCTMQDSMVVTKMENNLEARISKSSAGDFDCGITSIDLNGSAWYKGEYVTDGISYTWSGPNGFSATTQAISATEAGQYILMVTDKNKKLSASTNITLKPAIYPVGSAGPNKKLTCDNPSVMLEGTMTRGDRVIWLASDGGNIVSGERTLNPIVDAPGTYTMIIQFHTFACQSKYEVKVTREDDFLLSATGGKLDCSSGSVQLTATSDKEGLRYTWNGPDGFTSNTQNPTVKSKGNYTLLATDPETGCSKSTMVVVTPASSSIATEKYIIDFNNEKKGLISSIDTEAGPVIIMGRKRVLTNPSTSATFATENHAAIFDSQAPTGDDADLYTADWGNVLIINKDLTNMPDDNQWGGELVLDFSQIGPVTMESLNALDIDTYETMSWVYLYDGDGKELQKVHLKNLGNNSKQTVDLGNTRGVMKLKVVLDGRNDLWQLTGSGAIDDIKFRIEKEVSSPCETVQQEAILAQAYPTSFSKKAMIQFSLQEAGNYSVNLYDTQGNLVKKLKSGNALANEQISIEVTADNLKDGMYLAQIISKSGNKTLKLILTR